MNTQADYDLLIRARRVVCLDTGLDSPGAIAIRGDRIVTTGAEVDGDAREVLNFPDAMLLPGLIDLHAHPARAGSVFGIDPDEHMLPRGTTTVLSQGDAGSNNCETFVRETIDSSQIRVRLALNLSSVGESTDVGCFEHPDWIDVDACVAAAQRFREHVWGIAVNSSDHACGTTDPREVLRRGLLAAEETGLPLLYGMRSSRDWPFEEQLPHLRAGDVVTYCYRREPHGIVARGHVHPAVRAARERGILFDVGHGCASFDFDVAETAIRDGFPPDTISTDFQARHVSQTPMHDLPLVMSKLLAAGMPERDVLAAVTSRPAVVLGLDHEIGSLRPGTCADLTLLQWQPSGPPLLDAHGNERGGEHWSAVLTVRAGRPCDLPGVP